MVGNKTKGRISKQVFQESKARQNFRKTNISYPQTFFINHSFHVSIVDFEQVTVNWVHNVLKVNNKDTNVNLEQNSHTVLLFPLLTLNKYMVDGFPLYFS